MKKLAIAAAVAAACTGAAHAYQMGTFSNGVVIPNVFHDGNEYTAVGVISREKASIYWTFFDQDSKHVTDGCFTVTENDFEPFIWNAETAGVGLEGQRGYLVLAADTAETTCAAQAPTISSGNIFSANAFQVMPPADVAYVPVVDGPLTIAGNLTTLGPNSLTSAGGAAPVGDTLYMRYFIDNADTRIVVWSTGDQSGTHTVNIYNDQQDRKSVNFELVHTELDWFDPETFAGRPADFVDGFIVWNTSAAAPTLSGSIFSYSVIDAPAFGAVQTVLNPHN